MRLSTERRKETGAFYTPKLWADTAMKHLKDMVVNYQGEQKDLIFYDPCCGEGALLEAVRDSGISYDRLLGSSLEAEDVTICQAKGFTCFQSDFLTADLTSLFTEEEKERLVVFTNPPYVKYPKREYEELRKHYGTNDSVLLFLYRIRQELEPFRLALFSKTDIISRSSKTRPHIFELDLPDSFIDAFACSSKEEWGLKGRFAILFSIYSRGYFDTPEPIRHFYDNVPFRMVDLYKNGDFSGYRKRFYY